MAERVQVRAITNQEGNRLLRIVRRGTGCGGHLARAQMVLLSAQAMDVPRSRGVTFTSEDRVRDVIHNFNADGFEALYPRYRGGRAAQVHAPRATADQEGRALAARGSRICPSRPGAWPSWPTSWSPRG